MRWTHSHIKFVFMDEGARFAPGALSPCYSSVRINVGVGKLLGRSIGDYV